MANKKMQFLHFADFYHEARWGWQAGGGAGK